MYPAVADVVKLLVEKSSVLFAETLMVITPLAVFEIVPPMVVMVKFSVAVIPAAVIDAPVPVPFTTAKIATSPLAKDWLYGPPAVKLHLFAVVNALPSPMKYLSTASARL